MNEHCPSKSKKASDFKQRLSFSTINEIYQSMENPFFKSHWGCLPRRSRYDPSGWESPVKRSNPTSRIVNIPVRFVGSERSKSDSAVKIQKLFRGFMVRKSMKKIMAMRREADGIERKLQDREFIELIGTNAKERLKVNETLMNLLLKLDSVRGMDSGVRESRKGVIKKVIALQEKIDAIVADENAAGVVTRTPAADNEHGENHSAYCLAPKQQLDDAEIESQENQEKDADSVETMANGLETDGMIQSQPMDHSTEEMVTESEVSEVEDVETVNELKSSNLAGELADSETSREQNQKYLKSDSTDECLDAKTEFNLATVPSTQDGAEQEKMKETEIQPDCSPNFQTPTEDGAEKMEWSEILQPEGEENNKNNELLEKNERMIGLMAELLEKNETQNRLLKALSERVEYLEKTFISEKLRKKKRRNAAAATATPDCSAKCGGKKKCGRKCEK